MLPSDIVWQLVEQQIANNSFEQALILLETLLNFNEKNESLSSIELGRLTTLLIACENGLNCERNDNSLILQFFAKIEKDLKEENFPIFQNQILHNKNLLIIRSRGGICGFETNVIEMERMLEGYSKDSDNAYVQFLFGRLFTEKGITKEANKHYLLSCNGNFPAAFVNCGNLRKENYKIAADGGEMQGMVNYAKSIEPCKAFCYLERAAKLFHPEANFRIGEMLRDGHGCSADEKKALHYFERASNLKVEKAHFWAGSLNEKENETKAVQFYKRGSKRNECKSIHRLGMIYFNGMQNIPKDYYKAIKYFKKASLLGHAESKLQLETIEKSSNSQSNSISMNSKSSTTPNKLSRSSNECIICMDKEREVVLLPCKHYICCADCSKCISKECPVCKSIIVERMKLFK